MYSMHADKVQCVDQAMKRLIIHSLHRYQKKREELKNFTLTMSKHDLSPVSSRPGGKVHHHYVFQLLLLFFEGKNMLF